MFNSAINISIKDSLKLEYSDLGNIAIEVDHAFFRY